MIRSCNIAIYYRLIIYSNIKDVLFGKKAVARETMMLASEVKSHLVDKRNYSAADGKLKVVHKWVGLCWIQSFMLILGRVGLGRFTCGSVGSGRENWTHVQLWGKLTLRTYREEEIFLVLVDGSWVRDGVCVFQHRHALSYTHFTHAENRLANISIYDKRQTSNTTCNK